jgi:transposase
VFDAVEHVVVWGLQHRTLGQIDAIGVDQIQYMWERYLKVIQEKCSEALHILDRFHIARSLRQRRELILNYFRAGKLISSGVVEGLNNKAKVTMRRSYGFRTYRVLELALYHSLGKLPEPESTHDFF